MKPGDVHAVLPSPETRTPLPAAPAEAEPAQPGAELRFPERSPREWWWALAVAVATALAYIPFLRCEWFAPDEGILLQGAERILHGQVLYRDFFSFYTPGSYYGLALLFRLFGDSVLTGRVALLIEGAVMAALTYLIARRVTARWAALLAAYAMAVMCLPCYFMTLHNWDSTLLAYLALYAAVLWLQYPAAWLGAAAGTLAALTCLDEQSKGAGLVLGLLLAGLWLARQPQWRRPLRRQWRWMAVAFAGPVLATAGYFALEGALGAIIGDVLWPLRHYGTANAIPYGYMFFHTHVPANGTWLAKSEAWLWFSPHFAILLLPWIGTGVAAALWLRQRPHRPTEAARGYYLLVGTVMAGLLLSILISRQDYSHVVYLAPVFCIVVAWLVGRPAAGSAARRAAPVLAIYIFLFFSIAGMQYWARAITGYPVTEATAHGRLRVAVSDPVLAYLRRLPPGPIFVYPYLPDYYYLSGRANPTRFEWLQLGQNSQRQFATAQRELAASPPVAVLFDFGAVPWEATVFPGLPAGALARRHGVENYIFGAYRHCATIPLPPDRWAVMLPRGTPCPAAVAPPRHR